MYILNIARNVFSAVYSTHTQIVKYNNCARAFLLCSALSVPRRTGFFASHAKISLDNARQYVIYARARRVWIWRHIITVYPHCFVATLRPETQDTVLLFAQSTYHIFYTLCVHGTSFNRKYLFKSKYIHVQYIYCTIYFVCVCVWDLSIHLNIYIACNTILSRWTPHDVANCFRCMLYSFILHCCRVCLEYINEQTHFDRMMHVGIGIFLYAQLNGNFHGIHKNEIYLYYKILQT